MKKFLVLTVLFVGTLLSAQGQNVFDNPDQSFKEAPKKSTHSLGEYQPKDRLLTQEEMAAASGPGNEDGGDDLPIDDYIPLFVLVALGMIVFQTRFRSKAQS